VFGDELVQARQGESRFDSFLLIVAIVLACLAYLAQCQGQKCCRSWLTLEQRLYSMHDSTCTTQYLLCCLVVEVESLVPRHMALPINLCHISWLCFVLVLCSSCCQVVTVVTMLCCLMYSMYLGSHAFTIWGTFPPTVLYAEPRYISLLTTATFFVSFATCI